MKGFIEVTCITGGSIEKTLITEKLTINLIDIRNFKEVYDKKTRIKLTYEEKYTWVTESYEQIKELIKQAQG